MKVEEKHNPLHLYHLKFHGFQSCVQEVKPCAEEQGFSRSQSEASGLCCRMVLLCIPNTIPKMVMVSIAPVQFDYQAQ